MIKLYDSHNIDTLPWPDTPDGQYAKNFISPLVKEGVNHFFANIDTIMMAVTIDDHVLPMTINESQYTNSYVCSPYGLYFGFANDHIQNLQNRHLRRLAQGGMQLLEPILHRGKINQVVIVNNWLFSTNLYPSLSTQQVQALTEFLQKAFPQHTLLFRSIPSEQHRPSFLPQEYEMIPCRPIYVLDGRKEDSFRSRMFKSDMRILEKTDYSIVGNEGIQKEEIPRILELYRTLYIDKFSKRSPHITERFIEMALKNQLLSVKALKKEGRIDAVVGFFQRNGWMTSPLFGYDMSLSKDLGLYRIISTLVCLEAKKEKALLNQSFGAMAYKKLRRAELNIEFTAVFVKHLPWYRRLPWKLLKWLMNRVGLFVIRRLSH